MLLRKVDNNPQDYKVSQLSTPVYHLLKGEYCTSHMYSTLKFDQFVSIFMKRETLTDAHSARLFILSNCPPVRVKLHIVVSCAHSVFMHSFCVRRIIHIFNQCLMSPRFLLFEVSDILLIPTEEFAIDLGHCLRWRKRTAPCL
jgi:hypothetical protein